MWTDLTFNLNLLLMSDYPRAPPRRMSRRWCHLPRRR